MSTKSQKTKVGVKNKNIEKKILEITKLGFRNKIYDIVEELWESVPRETLSKILKKMPVDVVYKLVCGYPLILTLVDANLIIGSRLTKNIKKVEKSKLIKELAYIFNILIYSQYNISLSEYIIEEEKVNAMLVCLEMLANFGQSSLPVLNESMMLNITLALNESQHEDLAVCLINIYLSANKMPNNVYLYMNFLNSYMGLGTNCFKKAEEYATLAQKFSKDNIIKHSLACLYISQGEKEKALLQIKKAKSNGYEDWHQISADREFSKYYDDPEIIEFLTKSGVIIIKSVDDFHKKFPQIADKIRKINRCKSKKCPMTESQISKLKLAKYRNDGSKEVVSLPESIKTILRYDVNFSFYNNEPLLVDFAKYKNIIPSVNMNKVVKRSIGQISGELEKRFNKLPETTKYWNDEKKLPACIELYHPGDQEKFLYIGESNEEGEYPVVTFDDQPEVWITNESLISFIINEAVKFEIKIRVPNNFKKRFTLAEKKNEKYISKEKMNPEVEKIYLRYI